MLSRDLFAESISSRVIVAAPRVHASHPSSVSILISVIVQSTIVYPECQFQLDSFLVVVAMVVPSAGLLNLTSLPNLWPLKVCAPNVFGIAIPNQPLHSQEPVVVMVKALDMTVHSQALKYVTVSSLVGVCSAAELSDSEEDEDNISIWESDNDQQSGAMASHEHSIHR